jgi:hypothetical protein
LKPSGRRTSAMLVAHSSSLEWCPVEVGMVSLVPPARSRLRIAARLMVR